MKVLQINSVCGVGSTGRIATDIHTLIKEKGYDSWIAYGRGISKDSNNVIKIGNKIDNYFHVIKTRLLDKHGFGSKKATKEFIERIQELNPDIIHLHNIHGYYLNVEILFNYLKESNKPVVWTLHDCWSFTGHCAYFDFAGCNCWKLEGNHRCIQKKSYPRSILLNNSRKNFERKRKAFTGINDLTIVTPSKWLAELVKKSFLNEYPVKVINNGIDLTVFKPTKSNFRLKNSLENKFIVLGVAGSWETRKGMDYFLKLSKELLPDEVIVMVGLSKGQISNLPSNIIGITKTEDLKELAGLYTTANVFMNPTLEDNFPTTNLEAISCGTPVVTFDTGGCKEQINSQSGILVNKGDFEGLLISIREIKTKENINKEISDNIINNSMWYNKNDRFLEYIKMYEYTK